MQKHWMIAILASFALASIGTISLAQSIFNFGNTKSQAPQQPSKPSNQAMSPSQFKNTVKSLGQQNLNKLSQEVQQHVQESSKKPGAITPIDIQSTDSSNTSQTQANTAPATPSPTVRNNTPPPQAPVPASSFSNLRSATPPPAPTTNSTSTPNTSNQVYTGFDTGTGNKNSSGSNAPTNSSSSSSGWNINY